MTERAERLLEWLAAGDALGSSVEFVGRKDLQGAVRGLTAKGWPRRQAGGGTFRWGVGEPTDDTEMAARIVASTRALGSFDAGEVAGRWVAWMRSGPKDIGGTTRRALTRVDRGAPWWEAGLAEWKLSPRNSANGSLMRNGVMAGLGRSLEEVWSRTVEQAIVTHADPLSVMCCGVQSWLLWVQGEECESRVRGGGSELVSAFLAGWDRWLAEADSAPVRGWAEATEDERTEATEELSELDFRPASFDPFADDLDTVQGHSLLTLQIALWGVAASLEPGEMSVPDWWPESVRGMVGAERLAWVVMTGYDADTYGAVAGPLIGHVHGGLPAGMTDGLQYRVLLGA